MAESFEINPRRSSGDTVYLAASAGCVWDTDTLSWVKMTQPEGGVGGGGGLTDTELRASDVKVTLDGESVPVTAASLPLPSGAATEAKQDTGNTSLATIAGMVGTNDAAYVSTSGFVMMVGAQFDDASSNTMDEDDAGALRMNANRSLYVTLRGPTTSGVDYNAGAGGANTIRVVTATNSTIGTVTAVGTITPGTGATNLGKEEGGLSYNTGDVGVLAMAVNNLGAYAPLRTADGTGGLLIDLPYTTINAMPDEGQQTMAGSISVAIASDQTAVPVSAASLPLPANAAQETGGNLATIAAKDFSTSAKQDTIITALAALLTELLAKTEPADSQNVIGPITDAQLRAEAVDVSPLALVSDAPSSYNTGEAQPLSITTQGRLRVSSVESDNTQVWQHTFDNPWFSDNAWEMEGLYV